jgi:hypothetical protein
MRGCVNIRTNGQVVIIIPAGIFQHHNVLEKIVKNGFTGESEIYQSDI